MDQAQVGTGCALNLFMPFFKSAQQNRAWFKKINEESAAIEGEKPYDQKLARHPLLQKISRKEVIEKLGFLNQAELYLALGTGRTSIEAILAGFKKSPSTSVVKEVEVVQAISPNHARDVTIIGHHDLEYRPVLSTHTR